MLRTIYRDPDRYRAQYWSEIPGVYFTGDGARRDKDGYYWIMGRVDDVLNVSGHRLSTMEVESALVAHDKVAEAAVVGRPDDIKGQAISAFVSLEHGVTPSPELKEELKRWVAKEIGALAKPDDIRFTDMLPKTRSGKIMRRLLRELVASDRAVWELTQLVDEPQNLVSYHLRQLREGGLVSARRSSADRRDTYYGHKIFLTTGRSGLILDCAIPKGNPADSTWTMPLLRRQTQLFGQPPRQASFDGAFASTDHPLLAQREVDRAHDVARRPAGV